VSSLSCFDIELKVTELLQLFFGAVAFMYMGIDEQSDAIKCIITKTVEAFSSVE
jgi:hypothetical protein